MDRLNKLFTEVLEEVREAGIPVSSNLCGPGINTRAKSRLGCCKAGAVYTIEISAYVLDAEDHYIKEIIAHELLHTCRGCMNHGKKWKEYAAIMEGLYGYRISRTRSFESIGLTAPQSGEAMYKYRLVCRECGAEILRKKRCRVVENPQNYRCGKCGGKLQTTSKNTTSCR